MMRRKPATLLIAALLAGLAAGQPGLVRAQGYEPPMADEAPPGETEPGDDGLSLIERGVGILMQNLWQDVGPDLDRLGQDMSQALSRMSPVLEDLSTLVDDLGNYQAPERLANGDVIIRRKPGAPPPPPIGDSLRNLPAPNSPYGPDAPGSPVVPRDPNAPEVEL